MIIAQEKFKNNANKQCLIKFLIATFGGPRTPQKLLPLEVRGFQVQNRCPRSNCTFLIYASLFRYFFSSSSYIILH